MKRVALYLRVPLAPQYSRDLNVRSAPKPDFSLIDRRYTRLIMRLLKEPWRSSTKSGVVTLTVHSGRPPNT